MNRPWMPLYIADYRADTAHLSAAEHGAYLLLIMHYWTAGSLPDSDAPLARIACMTSSEWKKARPVVQAFFHDGWKHKRIDEELAKTADISSKRRAAAEQRHGKTNARADANASANADANASHMDTHAGTCASALQSQPQSQERKKQDAAGAAPDREREPASPPPASDVDYYRRAREVLGPSGGGLARKLLDAKDGSIPLARAVLETASTKANPREYVAGATRGKPPAQTHELFNTSV